MTGIGAQSDGERASVQAVLDLSTPCVNPTLEVDGLRWNTDDSVPQDWTDMSEMNGSIQMVSDDRAIFTADDGTRLNYVASPGFSGHPCKLA